MELSSLPQEVFKPFFCDIEVLAHPPYATPPPRAPSSKCLLTTSSLHRWEVGERAILVCNAESPDSRCRVFAFPLLMVCQGTVLLHTAEGVLDLNLDQFGHCLVLWSNLEQGLSFYVFLLL